MAQYKNMAQYKRGWKWTGVFAAVFLALALGFFLVFFISENSNNTFTGAAIGILNSGNASQCGGINTTTSLTQNVSSTGTCFTINASNIILDCRGFEINYSINGDAANAVFNVGFDNVTVRNCQIREGSGNGTDAYALYFQNGADNATIYNNTVWLIGSSTAVGVWLINSNETNISYNTFNNTGAGGGGVFIELSSSVRVEYNIIRISGTSADAVSVINASSNYFISNHIQTTTGQAIRLQHPSQSNVFLNNNITSEVNNTIFDDTSAIVYNQLIYNNSLGEIYWNLSNLTTFLNLTLGSTVFVENNRLGIVEDPNILRLNDTARLRFYNLSYTSSVPTLIRNGSQCDHTTTCNRSYDIAAGVLTANVSTFIGNFTTEGCSVLSGNKNLRANVTGNATCFTIDAANVVLNCAGYKINYSSAGILGRGIDSSTGSSNITVQNCVIVEGTSTTNSKSGIFYSGSENGTIYNNTITITGTLSNAIDIFNANRTNISANTIFVRSDATGIMISPSSLHPINFNRIHISAVGGSSTTGISLAQPSFSNYVLANNITLENTGTGISLTTAGSDRNIFANNTIYTRSGTSIDDFSTVTNNTLIYEGNFGTINWTSSNLTTNLSLIVGTTIFIENNTLGVADSRHMLELNRSAQITMRGLPYSLTPQLLKAGTKCDGTIFCNITYNSDTGVLTANVSSFSNYTTLAAAPLVTIINPANGSNLSSGTQDFNATIAETNIDAVLFSFNNASGVAFNATAQNRSGNWNVSLALARLQEGRHTMTVLANNTGGGYNRTSFIDFVVDRIPPNVTQVTLNNFSDFINLSPGLSANFISLNATVNDSTTTVQAVFFEINSTNGTRFNVSASRFAGRWNATINLSLLTESVHSARVYANDTLSNINNSQYITFLVNRTDQVDAGGGGGAGAGGGGGGAGGGGTAGVPEVVIELECQADTDCGNDEYCTGNECHQYLCHSDDDCRPGLYCVDYACTRVFDLKIVDLMVNPGELDFTYGMKNIFKQAGDVTLRYSIIDVERKEIASGSDIIFVGADDVVEQATLFFPPTMMPGEYQLFIQLTYKNYAVTSYRTFHVTAKEIAAVPTVVGEEVPRSNLFGQAIGAAGSVWKFLQSYIWLLLVSIIIVVAGGIIAAKTKPKKSGLDSLELWIENALAHGKSKEQIHTILQQQGWPELNIHLAIEQAEAVQQLQQKYNLSLSQIDETKKFIRKSARQGVAQADVILSLVERGWDKEFLEQLVMAYYVG